MEAVVGRPSVGGHSVETHLSSNLVAALAGLNVHDLSHVECVGFVLVYKLKHRNFCRYNNTRHDCVWCCV